MRLWIAKQRYLIDFTLASLARRKTKNIGLVLVFSLLVFALASVTLLTSALRQEAARVLAQSPEVLLQRMVAGRHDLIPPGYIERIGRIRGVQQVEGRLWGYYYDAVVKANYTFQVARRESATARPHRRRPRAGALSRGPGRQRPVLPLLFGQVVHLHGRRRFAGRIRTGQRRPRAAQRSRFPRLLRLPGRPFHRHCAERRQPAGSAHGGDQAGRRAARFTADPARRGVAHLPVDLRLARGHRPGAPFGGHPGLRHPRLGQGFRTFGRGKARDRHPQGDRLGDRRRDPDEAVGRASWFRWAPS